MKEYAQIIQDIIPNKMCAPAEATKVVAFTIFSFLSYSLTFQPEVTNKL